MSPIVEPALALDPEPFLSAWAADFWADELASLDRESPATNVTTDRSPASVGLRFIRGGLPEAPVGDVTSEDDPWSSTVRVAPRPLAGVSGVWGPELAPALTDLDLARLSPAQLIEVVTGAERLVRWAHSVQLAAVGAFADYAVITDEDTRDDPLPEVPGGRRPVETGFGTQREIEAFCADGIGAALGVSFTAGQQLIDTACFTAVVPLAAAALATGRVDLARVKVLARELAPVGYDTEEQREFVDGQVSGHEDLTPKKLQARVREAVMARSPDEAAEVRRREEKRRGVWLFRQPAGMASLTFRLRADEAQLAYQALNAAAWHRHDQSLIDSGRNCESGEFRPFDNYRADAFMAEMRDLQLRYLRRQPQPDAECPAPEQTAPSAGAETESPVGTPTSNPPEAGPEATREADDDAAAPAQSSESGTADPATSPWGPEQMASPARARRGSRMMDPARVMLHLYLDAATLVGLQNRPATLLGYGPIDADLAREMAQDAAVVRLLTDPFTGHVQAIDLPAYRVPKILRWAVQARDRTCVFPGCDVPAYDNQLDHINPHPFARKLRKAFATGSTSFANLHSLCLRHHYLKTHGGWTIQTTSGSRLEWISPTGHSYRRNPEWGPPAGFWKDHAPGLPIDSPPGARPTTDPAAPEECPF